MLYGTGNCYTQTAARQTKGEMWKSVGQCPTEPTYTEDPANAFNQNDAITF